MKIGRRRRIAIGILLGSIGLAATTIGLVFAGHNVWAATGILGVSLLGFHVAAFATSDCTKAWRAVDYPWVLATFMAIAIALTNIYEADRSRLGAKAVELRRQAYQSLLYALRSTITNDCHPKASRAGMWTPSPEPYDGACDRMEHFLPQIEDAAAREESVEGVNGGAYWGQNIVLPNTDPVGSWSGLYDEATRFTRTSEEARAVLEGIAALPPSPIGSWAKSEALKYWYFVLAFFLGLRLSRVTADLLAVQGGSNARRPARTEAVSETVEAATHTEVTVQPGLPEAASSHCEIVPARSEQVVDHDGGRAVSMVASQPGDAADGASRRS